METYDLIAQAMGIVGLVFGSFSFQMKSSKGVLLFQSIGSFFYIINYYMLGAYMGAILNLLAILRSIVYGFREKFRAERLFWLIAFSLTYVLSYVLLFSVFGHPATARNLCVEIIPLIAMVIATVAIRKGTARSIRAYAFAYSPMWLAYNIINFSIGAILGEAINFISVVIGVLRYDIKKNKG